MPNSTILQALLKYFDGAESLKALPESERKALRERMMTLDDEQAEAVIKILENENNQLALLKAQIKEYDNTIEDLFAQFKQAGKDLKMAFMKMQEENMEKIEKKKTDQLMEDLDEA